MSNVAAATLNMHICDLTSKGHYCICIVVQAAPLLQKAREASHHLKVPNRKGNEWIA